MKVEIDFAESYEENTALPIPIGRIYIGNYVGRFFFTPEGKTRLFINEKAVEDGSLVLLKDHGEIVGLGDLPDGS